MKHGMSDPCEHCPFRTDIHGYLHKERCVEIAESVLRGEAFPCHKTTKTIVDDEGEDRVADANSQECAGAAIFADHNGCSSQLARIAERLHMKVAKLNKKAPVVKTLREMIEVHCGEEAGETCAVVNEECLAPAGTMYGNAAVEGTEYVTTTCHVCGEYVCENCSKKVPWPQNKPRAAKKRVCDNCRED